MQSIPPLAANSFAESLRQPITLVLLLAVGLLLLLNTATSGFALGEEEKLLVDLGLSTIFLGGIVLAAFLASNVLTREIEGKTVLTVLSKPVSRPSFIIGKFLGLAGALTVVTWVWSALFLLTLRHHAALESHRIPDWPPATFGLLATGLAFAAAAAGNYLFRWVFGSRLTLFLAVTLPLAFVLVSASDAPRDATSLPQLLTALALLLAAILVVASVALAASVRLGQVTTLVLCLAVFLAGLSSDYLFGRFVQSSWLAQVGYTVLPNLQLLWLADALSQGRDISTRYLGLVSAYAALYVAGMLALATALFETREVG